MMKNPPADMPGPRNLYQGAVVFDDNGNVGKRYRRQDEIGTPECITIDFQTLDDNTVTIRNRDTAKQTRVSVDGLKRKSGFVRWDENSGGLQSHSEPPHTGQSINHAE